MGKSSTYKCTECGASYSKKLMRCPQCNSINKRRMELITSLELKVYHNPDIGLQCKKCGTIFPNDIKRCLYCSTPSDGAKRLSAMRGISTIETPSTKYHRQNGFTFKFDGSSSQKQSKPITMIACVACGQTISNFAEACPHCGQPTGVHVCPKCQSTNTKVISGASKATSIFLWGPFAANKVVSKFQCKDCGHKW